jgi:transposase-like protein
MAKWKRDAEREAFWRRALARQRESGLTVRAFCRREGVSEPSFYAWRRVVCERDAERRPTAKRPRPAAFCSGKPNRRPAQPRFLPVVLREAPTPAGGGIVIAWQGGRRMRLPATVHPDRLAALVHALEASPAAECRP